MRILFLDLVGGISGDMLVGALVDLGVPLDVLRDALGAAGISEVDIAVQREARHQIAGTRFLVSHRGGARADSGVVQTAAQRAVAAVSGGPGYPHRAYREIHTLLERAKLAAPVRDTALQVFAKLAESEGAAHGVPPEDVEFHEVGSWDAIADIVCAAAALHQLALEAIYCSTVPLGAGQVRSAHGMLPVPGPATLRLLQGFPVQQGGPPFERTSPTGAALLAALALPVPQPFQFTPERTGIGLGKADPPEVANLLRAVLGQTDAAPVGVSIETVELAAANVDDANPEWIGFAMERLLAAGALDVALLPIQMKKNRPGTQIQVLYPPAQREHLLPVLLREVPTLGVRFQSWQRWVLPRRAHTVSTPWGAVAGKVATFEGRERFTPEFEACRAIAQAQGVPLLEVYRAAQRAWEATQV